MSNDIAIQKLGNIDYIPKDGVLCERCRYYDICPFDYTCKTLAHLVKFEFGGEE